MMNTEPLVRITVKANRKPGMAEAEFHRYWAQNHGPLVSDWLIRCGIVRYVQYHTTTEYRGLAKSMSKSTNRPIEEYDASADFYVRKYEDFEAAFEDPEYREKIQPDEKKFFDMDSLVVTVGVDYVVVDNGKKMEEHAHEF